MNDRRDSSAAPRKEISMHIAFCARGSSKPFGVRLLQKKKTTSTTPSFARTYFFPPFFLSLVASFSPILHRPLYDYFRPMFIACAKLSVLLLLLLNDVLMQPKQGVPTTVGHLRRQIISLFNQIIERLSIPANTWSR